MRTSLTTSAISRASGRETEVLADTVAAARAATAETVGLATTFRRSHLSDKKCSMPTNLLTAAIWEVPKLLLIRKNTLGVAEPSLLPMAPIHINTAIRWVRAAL